MSNDLATSPNRFPWPPILYLGAVAIGLVLDALVPLGHGGVPVVRAVGFVLLAMGVALHLWTYRAFQRSDTTVMPHRGATHLVTDGPFAWSRNPIYLGNTLALVGAGLAFDVLWLVVLAPLAVLGVTRLAILREERHLALKFGAAWDAYAARVRRWL